MQSVFPYSVPSITWDTVRLAWIYTVQTVNIYWVGDETYTPQSQTEQYIIFPKFTVSKYVESWFKVNATWGSINFGNFTDYTRMIAQSTTGRLALTAIPFIILLVAGGHYAGIAILVSSAIALAIQLSIKDIVSLFTIPFLGVMMFIGVLALFRQRGGG
jgi:nitrate reductase gamma subunit